MLSRGVSRAVAIAVGVTVAGLVARSLTAGPLSPPGGPVAPTYKTLVEVEPRVAINAANTPGTATAVFRITQAGSYYLMDNVTGVSGKNGIAISASNVTLDLNGFAMQGVSGSLAGITADVSGLRSIRILNGSVSSWGGSGIELGTPAVNQSRIEGAITHQNGTFGIRSGTGSVIIRCQASNNASYGIIAFDGGVVEECVANNNASIGIGVGGGGVIRGCMARNNQGSGIELSSAMAVNCEVYGNDVHGVLCSGTGSTVADCTAAFNGPDGVRGTSSCRIVSNEAHNNGTAAAGGANIVVVGGDSRAEGNNCTLADRGLEAVNAGNIIIRNTCSGNTLNWSIVANNVVGPIIDRTAPASAAISGNSGPDSTGSTHPQANFTY